MSRQFGLSLLLSAVLPCWGCAAPSQPSPPAPLPVPSIAGTYSAVVSASASCHTLPGIVENPVFFGGSMVPGITLNQSGADVFQHSDVQEFTGFYSTDISGTVDAQSLRLTTVKLINNNKFDQWNISGTGIGVIQGRTVTGTISGTFQRERPGFASDKFVNCTATDHQFRFVPMP